MAWFKFGKQDSTMAPDGPVETVETLRTRAKRRLIGALVLVTIAVVGFPLLFETQPRPSLVDVPIEIPDKAKVKPLALPPSAPASAAKVEDKASLGSKEEIVAAAPAAPAKTPEAAASPSVPAVSSKVAPMVDPAAAKAAADKDAADKAAKLAQEKVAAEKAKAEATKADAAKAEAAKAQALLEGKSTPVASGAEVTKERFVVQFGSFAESAKAQEVRKKVEAAGLKTYAQVADTSEGKRHRARVGPFASRAEAEKAASKIKALGLPANILTL